MNKEEKENIEKAPLDASLKVNSKEARKLLKENGGKVQNGDVEAFVRLKDINKIYPNGVQAVMILILISKNMNLLFLLVHQVAASLQH